MARRTNRVIIVGAGQAALTAAFELRQLGYEGEIVLFGDEPYLPYERPELSKGYVAGSMEFEKLRMADAATLDKSQIEVRTSAPVTELNLAERSVRLATGDRWEFDFLILATGGRARTLPGCLTLRTRDDADALAAAAKQGQSIAIFGAGWLGLELAAFAKTIGLAPQVFDPAPWPCARVLPQDVAETLKALHIANRVNFSLGATPDVSRITAGHDVSVACIGMIPNDDLAAHAGLAVDGGIIVDEAQRTRDQNVFAIGDCARRNGQPRVESWDHANQSAKRAAAAICGIPDVQTPTQWFWSNQGATKIQIVGEIGKVFDVSHANLDTGGDVWRYEKDGKLVGAIAINAARDFAKLRRKL